VRNNNTLRFVEEMVEEVGAVEEVVAVEEVEYLNNQDMVDIDDKV